MGSKPLSVAPRPFRRDTGNAVLGGVASGLGDYFDVDPLLVRLGFVFLTFINGIGLLFYLVCWVVIPAQGQEEAAARSREEWVAGAKKASEQVAAEARRVGEVTASSVRQATSAMGGATRKAARPARTLLGFFLIGLGLLLLADELGMLGWPMWASFATLWPVVLIVMGASLMRSGLHSGRA